MSITSIENLSKELFYEIFDYLDAINIYQSFSNLNHHFQQLLNSSSILLKIKFHGSTTKKTRQNNHKQMKLLNKHQIFSINLSIPLKINEFFSSFSRLESLILNRLDSDILMPILFKLSDLPRLVSLTIVMFNDLKDLTDIYRLIFNLTTLKYYTFKKNNADLSVSLPAATDNQRSTIEYLVIDHHCTFSELSAIISYTPQLRRLNFNHSNDSDPSVETIVPITLLNLTDMFIRVYPITFDDFEIFITNIYSKLNVLSVSIHSIDMAYLDANRWEKLILQYFPQLEKFYYKYYEHIFYEYEYPIHTGEPNEFSSAFWTKRQWIFEAEMDGIQIMYSIQPYKKRWYQCTQDTIVNSSIELPKLVLINLPPVECHKITISNISRLSTVSEIYHLEVPNEEIFIGTLLQITDLLPELVSLKIHSLSLYKPRDLYRDEADILCSAESTITKVYLETMVEIAEFYFLMALCPDMKHFQVNCINDMDGELFLFNVLDKIKFERNKHLRSLCFRVPAADDEMITKLQEMINCKKILLDYTIKRVLDNICLQWK